MKKNKYCILGVEFQEETLPGVVTQVRQAWQQKTCLRITTINPEFLVLANKDHKVLHNLQAAPIKLVDGIGLWLALAIRGFTGKRITGATLLPILLTEAEKLQKKVLIILKSEGLSSKSHVIAMLLKKYPQLSYEVVTAGEHPQHLAELVCIATGFPDQEYSAATQKHGVVVGVGGALDFLTGTQKRAPKIIQAVGLEWLWRFMWQPNRFGRIFSAVVTFPYLLLFATIRR